MTDPRPTLIIGATGKTGRRIAERLETAGVSVRRGARSSETPFDWEDRATWAPALDGARAAYISYFPDLAFPGAVEAVGALAETARGAGVERLVLLSGRGEHHARMGEEAVLAAGVPTTRLRCAWFAQNFSEGYLRDPILSGVLPMPGGDVVEPILDVEDIAEVAAKALRYDGTDSRFYELTGPRCMSFADMADTLTRATGRPIRHVPITFEDFHEGLAQGAGAYVADVFTAIARETLDGRNAQVSDGVQRALGRPATDFADYAARAARAGAWSPVAA
ncbi:NmrA family transcriptional regulator [uncultured Jannaschia sp.]|uniref:NmrA family transcriptional regulator n=1 Tax=uncultured Jannaschia sp. TaxID=293347 RepID=UPI00261107A8|nr:NmrA family transcriptional regulator [uncultured Jannaschia sp.]